MIKAQIDGKSLGNPGRAYWIALFDRKLGESNRYYGEGDDLTNNEAEYNGLILALEKAPENCELEIETDSKLLVGQMTQNWRINYPHLYELNQKANDLIRRKCIKLNLKWIPREKNISDLVLNRHLRKTGILEIRCPLCGGNGYFKQEKWLTDFKCFLSKRERDIASSEDYKDLRGIFVKIFGREPKKGG